MSTAIVVVPVCILAMLYAGIRYMLVGVVRDAETRVDDFCHEVEDAVTDELRGLAEASVAGAGDIADASKTQAESVETGLARFCSERVLCVAAIRRGLDGALHAVRRNAAGDLVPAPADAFARYLDADSPLLHSAPRGSWGGLVTVCEEPTLAVAVPLSTDREFPDVLLIGRYLRRGPVSRRIEKIKAKWGFGHRIQSLPPHPSRPAANRSRPPAPVFGERLSLRSGGPWHVGRDSYETRVTLQDVQGTAIGAMVAALPASLPAATDALLGRLGLGFLAFALLQVLLLQLACRHGVAAPLAELRRAVQDAAKVGSDARRLGWTRRDALGDLARAFDELLDHADADARRLAAREEQNLALLAAVPDAFCVFAADGLLASVTGGSAAERRFVDALMPGEPFPAERFTRDSAEAFLAALRQASETATIATLVLPRTDSDEDLYVECRMSRIDGTRVVAACRNVSSQYADKRQLADMENRLAQLQHHESLGRLVAGIAHDFNNLLAVIQSSLDRYQNGAVGGANASDELLAIAQAARHAANLIRQLQVYAGLSDMTFEAVSLNTLLAGTQPLLRASVPHRIALEFDPAPYLPDIVADATQLVQVLSNLVINAAEAIGERPGTIRVATRLLRREELDAGRYIGTKPLSAECYVQFSVMDTGRGISPTQLDRISEPFFSTKGEGRGLGLATVAGILAAHDGAIEVSSQLGEGSVFAVVLPVPDVAPPSPSAPTPASPSLPAGRPPCLLLVDDDARVRRVTRLLLESLGCEVLEADEEREVRLQLQRHLDRIDGVLLDANVHGMDGVRALRAIRQKSPKAPVFLFSGHDEAEVRRAYAGFSFDGFIPKPFPREALIAMLTRVQASCRAAAEEPGDLPSA